MIYEFHKIANIFPLIERKEFYELVSDIQKNGLLEPIWLYENKILDGRNRYKACIEAGVEPEYKKYEGDDPLQFVIGINIRRRHLTPSQRAILASEVLEFYEAEAKERQIRKPISVVEKIPPQNINKSREVAGKQFDVNDRYVSEAKRIKVKDPIMFEQIKRGEKTIQDFKKAEKIQEREVKIAEIKERGNNTTLQGEVTLLEGDIFEQIQNIPDNSIDLLMTDPPYFVMKDYEWDKEDWNFLDKWLKVTKEKLKDSYNGFIFCDARMMYKFEKYITKYHDIKNTLIWIRKNLANGRVIKGRFISSYEVVFFVGNKDLNLPEQWGAERFDSFEYATPQSNFKEGKYHPTQKPLELFRRLIELGSKDGEVLLDPFAGSGTTGIIAKQLNRKCYLIEKDSNHCDMIKGRICDVD